MIEEDVGQYFTAKHTAARRVLGPQGARRVCFRPRDLPSNGEIRAALLVLVELAEGERRHRRLFAMRVTGLEVMEALSDFTPRLIGSVSSGHVRRGSDIDLHVFTDEPEHLESRLEALGWPAAIEQVPIWKDGRVQVFTHVHVALAFPVELSVYPVRELRIRTRSSTDGRPIDRVSPARLRRWIAAEHPEEWDDYLQTGQIRDLDQILEDAARSGGAFDGLLASQRDDARRDP